MTDSTEIPLGLLRLPIADAGEEVINYEQAFSYPLRPQCSKYHFPTIFSSLTLKTAHKLGRPNRQTISLQNDVGNSIILLAIVFSVLPRTRDLAI